MSTWTLKEKSCGDLNVVLEGDAWKAAQKKAFDKLAKNVQVEGFRKGKAPKRMVEKMIPVQSILVEAAEMEANNCLMAAVEEHNLWLVDRPTLEINDINEEKVDYTFKCTVKPEAKLGQYKGLAYEVKEVEVTEDEINAELAKIQENFAELQVKDGAVEEGDTAVIDFEGFKDGVAFEGGKGENYPLVIGSHSFIPGFEEQVCGMTTGETKDLNVTFPENYGAADLAGKAVVFTVTVKEVKAKVLPALDDELAKDVNMDGVDTLEDLKKSVSEKIAEAKKQANENEALDALINALVDNAEVDIPEVMIEQEAKDMISEQDQRMQQQGFSLTQYMQMTGMKMEDLVEQMKGDAERRVRVRLVLEAVVKAENIVATEEDIEAEFDKLASMYKMEKEEVKKYLDAETLSYDVRMQKALDFVKESSK